MSGIRPLPALVVLALAALLVAVPALGLPAFYVSFLYVACNWVSLATSWAMLSGYAGYWSFGHAAFFGVGVYAAGTLAAKLGVPFLLTIPAAAALSALLGAAVGFVVFRVKRLRGELFALMTISVTAVVATIISNTPIDGGSGVYLIGVALPELFGSQNGTIYLLGLGMAVIAMASSYAVAHSRLGLGLFAIHDDEDVAEVKGVPTFRYKLAAFALSAAIAGAVGAVYSIYVSYVTVSETFEITVTMYPVVMTILGGARNWAGPALGAVIVTSALYGLASGPQAYLGRGAIAIGLVLVILLLPQGVLTSIVNLWHRRHPRRIVVPSRVAPAIATPPRSGPAAVALDCRGVTKAFGGIQALKGVTLAVNAGEILGLVGPNGSGKSTLINVITGHYPIDRGSIAFEGARIDALPAHRVAALGIARSYQIPRPFNHLSVLDNVALAARFGTAHQPGGEAAAEAMHWLDYTGLA
ncbi:MAG TPA: ATP-binding cassette domain-containing protein, partial [Stellaceae bacterium]|nr:ATP-binding cassette domain-containing protein [Stellaceae bacterium]